MKTIFIEPRASWGLKDVKEMVGFRWVLWMLILRDIKLRYKQTVLGIAWVILQPLLTALLFTFVFGKWLHLPTSDAPYMLFAFCGLIPWLVFSQSIQRGGTSLVNEAQLVQKIYFPRLFLPMAATFGVALDYLFSLATFATLLFLYQYPPTWKVLLLPLWTILLFIFSSGLNILLSSLSAHYRDFKHIIPFFLQFWMYASPLAYSISSIPERWHWVFALNPLTGVIELFRWSLLGEQSFPFVLFGVSLFSSFVIFVFGLIVFRKLERTLSDVI